MKLLHLDHLASGIERFTAMPDFVIVRGGGNSRGRGAGLYFSGGTDIQQSQAVARQPRLQKLRNR